MIALDTIFRAFDAMLLVPGLVLGFLGWLVARGQIAFRLQSKIVGE